MIFIMCGIFRSLSRRHRGLSRRRRGRVATRRAVVTVCRGVSRVSWAMFFLSKPRHVLGHPSQGGVLWVGVGNSFGAQSLQSVVGRKSDMHTLPRSSCSRRRSVHLVYVTLTLLPWYMLGVGWRP